MTKQAVRQSISFPRVERERERRNSGFAELRPRAIYKTIAAVGTARLYIVAAGLSAP